MNRKSKSSKKIKTPTTVKKSTKRNSKSKKKKKSSTDINEDTFPSISELPKPEIEKDLSTLINEGICNLCSDADVTRNDIKSIFDMFRNKLNERENKLLHDVDTTLDKKTRLLQTQLEYTNDLNGGTTTPNTYERELACDPNM
eukprot:441707_1